MKSLEALWTAHFGNYENPDHWANSGVVIFESGRLFGGDSYAYYLGTFNVKDDAVTGPLAVTVFDPKGITAFGDLGSQINVQLRGKRINDDLISGEMTAHEQPGLKIHFELRRQADLP